MATETDAIAKILERSPMTNFASHKVIIRGCPPEEVTALLALWREAEATASVTDTVEDLSRAIVFLNETFRVDAVHASIGSARTANPQRFQAPSRSP